MTPVLSLLVWSLALTFVQMLIAVNACTLQVGLVKLAGNREDLPPFVGLAGRAMRAHRNMLENIVLFAALVLVAHVTGKTGGMVLLPPQTFFGARPAPALISLGGTRWLRTAAWLFSGGGMTLIFAETTKWPPRPRLFAGRPDPRGAAHAARIAVHRRHQP